jgi:hypothetical protein
MRYIRHNWKKTYTPFVFIMLTLFSPGCHSQKKKEVSNKTDSTAIESIKYKIITIKDFKPRLAYDENNNVVDTIIPSIIKSIRDGQYRGITSKEGLVKDALTAKRMAVAILESFYGKNLLQSEEPINVSLINDKYWYVNGTLPNGYMGGVAEILISREDGRILYLTHGK